MSVTSQRLALVKALGVPARQSTRRRKSLTVRNLRRSLPLMLMGLFAIGALALAACGGGGGGGGGSDEGYVKALCNATNNFTEKLGEAFTAADEEEATKTFIDAFNAFVDDMDSANPPSDAKEAHDAMVKALKDAQSAVDEGGLDALNSIDFPTIEPDQAVQDRLAKVAEGVSECDGADLFN